MEFYIEQLTVEEKAASLRAVRHNAIYPILEWFDDLGGHHDLAWFGSHVD